MKFARPLDRIFEAQLVCYSRSFSYGRNNKRYYRKYTRQKSDGLGFELCYSTLVKFSCSSLVGHLL